MMNEVIIVYCITALTSLLEDGGIKVAGIIIPAFITILETDFMLETGLHYTLPFIEVKLRPLHCAI